jgi:predicted membrane protein
MGFVAGLITAVTGVLLWAPIVWLLAGYVMLYLSAASFFAIKRAQETKTSAVLVLFSFVVLHISYGLGSLWAVVTIPFKFPKRGRKAIVPTGQIIEVVDSGKPEKIRKHQMSLN